MIALVTQAGPVSRDGGSLSSRCDPLHGRGSRLADVEILVGEHAQVAANHFEQLAGTEQEGRVRGPAEALVASGEGLVEQKPPGSHGLHQCGKQWPV